MIQITGLHKRFGPKVVLDGVSLSIERGEIHAIIGRSGEGKSVLLKILGALMEADAGEVTIEGRRIHPCDRASLAFVRSKVGMVFQYAALFDSLNVRENIGFALDEAGADPAKVDSIVERLLREVNLPGVQRLMPAELSGGMKKRIGLARALAPEPEILLYDEPTTGLDPVTTDIINRLILQTRRRHRVTSVLVTHDMGSAYKTADRISMLFEGRMIFTGSPDELKATNNPFVRQFVDGLAEGPITEKDQWAVERQALAARERAES